MLRTKKGFLRRLKWSLALRLPAGEAGEVLEDYAGFFDDKLAEGKTEAEVCAEFGMPSQVAGTILKEEGKAKPLGLLALPWGLSLPFVFWFGGLWFFGAGWLRVSEEFPFFAAWAFFNTPLLWLLWRKSVYPAAKPGRTSMAVLLAAPLVLFWGFYGLILYFVRLPSDWWDKTGVKVSNMGMRLGGLWELSLYIITAVLLLSLIWAWTRSPWYLVPAAHGIGCVAALSRIITVLHSMDVESGALGNMTSELRQMPPAVWLVVALGGAALTALLVWIGGRHGRAA